MKNEPMLKFYNPKELTSITDKEAILQDLKLIKTRLQDDSSGFLQAIHFLDQLIEDLSKT
jgi:hypothetical protein